MGRHIIDITDPGDYFILIFDVLNRIEKIDNGVTLSQSERKELVYSLAYSQSGVHDVEYLLKIFDFPISHIEFSNSLSVTWFNVIKELEKQGKLLDFLQFLRKEYPGNKVIERILYKNEGEENSKEVTV